MVTTPIGTSRTGVRWWQFSLGTLLLVALLACVGAAYFGAQTQFLRATKQNLELQEANSQLMKDRGILSVADESKILLEYRGKSRDPEILRWKWRVYVPEGGQWRFVCETGAIEKSGFNHSPGNQSQIPIWGYSGQLWGYSGQHNLELTIQRDLDGRPILILRIGLPGGDVRLPLSEQEFDSLRRLDNPHKSQPRGRPSIVVDSSSRLELIRIVSKDDENERTGLVIYFERVSSLP